MSIISLRVMWPTSLSSIAMPRSSGDILPPAYWTGSLLELSSSVDGARMICSIVLSVSGRYEAVSQSPCCTTDKCHPYQRATSGAQCWANCTYNCLFWYWLVAYVAVCHPYESPWYVVVCWGIYFLRFLAEELSMGRCHDCLVNLMSIRCRYPSSIQDDHCLRTQYTQRKQLMLCHLSYSLKISILHTMPLLLYLLILTKLGSTQAIHQKLVVDTSSSWDLGFVKLPLTT